METSLFKSIEVVSAERAFSTILQNIHPSVRNALQRSLFVRRNKAVTAVIESDYLDIDYSSSFFLQQGRSFTPLSRRTKRIHFFSSRVSKRHIAEESPEVINCKSYLGYIVIRPILPPTIGRTFIRPPESIDGYRAFCPTEVEVPVDLCGIKLKVKACPYISQDQLVMACATASLWMANNSLAPKVTGVRQCTTSEITALALSLGEPYGPALGSRGLRLDEEEKAFCGIGYDPKLYEYPQKKHLVEVCYTHVEGGIPPVLNVYFPPQEIEGINIEGLHVFTVVGHLMDTQCRRQEPIYKNIYGASEFVPAFIINDDQNGIYLRADVFSAGKKQKPLRAGLHIWIGNKKITGYCHSLLIPFPPRVWLPGTHATRLAAYWLAYFQSQSILPAKPLVVRTFLARSNVFKELLVEQLDIPQLKAIYRSLPLPRYIWVAEYGYLDDWIGTDCDSLVKQGEFIFDATLPPAVKAEWLTMHWQGAILVRRIKEETMHTEYYSIEKDKPCSLLLAPVRP